MENKPEIFAGIFNQLKETTIMYYNGKLTQKDLGDFIKFVKKSKSTERLTYNQLDINKII